MRLLDYLNSSFYTAAQLLEIAQITPADFAALQAKGMMPKASYELEIKLSCSSFFGPHDEVEKLSFYAKGYSDWLKTAQACEDAESLFAHFSAAYSAKLQALKVAGFVTAHPRVNAGLGEHIAEEWKHFLAGIYGLCTRTGLPEDIAAKEVAILIIEDLLAAHSQVDLHQSTRLACAVDLLDQASSAFAPHERARSSRQRLVDDLRTKYLREGAADPKASEISGAS